MIPKATEGLQSLAQRILSQVLPALGSKYVMSDTAMLGMLLTALSDELESGVARRLMDIAAMEQLLQQAQEAGFEVPESKNFAPGEQTLTGVNAHHDELTQALIELHEQVDAAADYHELNLSIWRYLAAHAERHALKI